MQVVLVTGVAGFIGSRVAEMLLKQGSRVIGIDNLNDCYDQRLKLWRLDTLEQYYRFVFYQVDIEDFASLRAIFRDYQPKAVINLAAWTEASKSMENPHAYFSTNAGGTLNLLELCRQCDVSKFVLASTSLLYAGQEIPFGEELPVNKLLSPYAASKKVAETLAHAYHHLYNLDVSVLRYFTVYGPAGRPDMDIFRFVRWIGTGIPSITDDDTGCRRNFIYIDDAARGTVAALQPVGYEIINLGSNSPHQLAELIRLIELYTGRPTVMHNSLGGGADIQDTQISIHKARAKLGWKPVVGLEEGMEKTVDWSIRNWDWLKNLKF